MSVTPIDVIAQAIRAKESTGRAASVFAEEILADLDEAGYIIRKKPAPRKPAPIVDPFAPNTGDPAVDEFMRQHHDPKWKPLPLPKSPGLPDLRPMKVSQQDAAERAWLTATLEASEMVALGQRSHAEVELRTLIALHRSPWVKGETVEGTRGSSSVWTARPTVTTYRSERHPGIELQRVRRANEFDIWRVVVNGVTVGADHYNSRFAEEAADAALEARRA